VFCGSVLWWLILSGVAQAMRARLGGSGLRWVNRLSGAVIVAFALAALWPLVVGPAGAARRS
jgi:putative LysE/RhtB family amino acid efflux pump